MPSLATVCERDAAVADLERDFHAASSRKATEMKLRTIKTAISKWGLALYPPTAASIKALAATLKRGGYRSAESYLLLYRGECDRRGVPYSADLVRIHRDCVRSCVRGLGGPVKALGLPFERLGELDTEEDGPWNPGGPMGPAAVVVAGAWFMTREVELSTTRAALVTLSGEDASDFAVQWQLPASKSDQQALGTARTHGCACGGPLSTGCPYHAVKGQLDRLRRLFPHRWSGTAFDVDLPLFPGVDGSVVTKEAMTATLVEAALRLKVPTETADGSGRVSSHSLRRTGAQGLARLGVDSWAIQLLGRWGSSAVLGYIQEVPLERSAVWARRAALGAAPSAELPVASVGVGGGAHGLPCVSATAMAELLEKDAGPQAASEADLSGVMFVRSAGMVWHKVPGHGSAGPMSAWTTLCGWRFARSDGIFESSLPQPLLHKFICKRCMPAEHRAAKEQC